MSQAGSLNSGGSGGSGIQTIDGDVGSVTGSTVTIYANGGAGASVLFSGSGTHLTYENTDASFNVYLGESAGQAVSGTHNTGVGVSSLADNTGGNNNTAIGFQSLDSVNTGSFNIGVGNAAGSNYTGAESSNICIGNAGVLAESHVIRIGTQGSGSGQQNECFVAGVAGVTVANTNMVTINTSTGQMGSQAVPSGITTINGDSGSVSGSTITIETLPGTNGGTAKFSGSGTTLQFIASDANNNTGFGVGCLSSITGTQNTALGQNALHAATSTVQNTAIGENALAAMVNGGNDNTALGEATMSSLTSGSSNVAIGQSALSGATSINSSVCIGVISGWKLTSGDNNTAVGGLTLDNCTSGTNNTVLGFSAGSGYTGSESSNILIGNVGTASENNVTRIGTQGTGTGQQNKCFIAGIFGTTTSDVGSTTAVLIDNTGNLGTVASSERFKQNIESMGKSSDAIMQLRPVTFTYKKDISNSRQYGLIAEEVLQVFPDLVSLDEEGKPFTVRYHELPSLLLNELIKMKSEILRLQSEVVELKKGSS